ncbi:MAG: ferritin-like domain-containing protein, partial [Bacteroidota bacterium]
HFRQWAAYFQAADTRRLDIPWTATYRLTPQEKALIGRSVRQFQLGESSDGRHLKRKVLRECRRMHDAAYWHAIHAFIKEEHVHAADLGRWMALEDIAPARKHWLDGLFRGLRHRLPLTHSVTLLLTAELIAVPYYTALGRATASPILNTICKQILQDEARHIDFQAVALRHLLARRKGLRRRTHRVFARAAQEVAVDLVWFGHGDVLRAGGLGYRDFRNQVRTGDKRVQAVIHGEISPQLPESATPPSLSLLSRRPIARHQLHPPSTLSSNA